MAFKVEIKYKTGQIALETLLLCIPTRHHLACLNGLQAAPSPKQDGWHWDHWTLTDRNSHLPTRTSADWDGRQVRASRTKNKEYFSASSLQSRAGNSRTRRWQRRYCTIGVQSFMARDENTWQCQNNKCVHSENEQLIKLKIRTEKKQACQCLNIRQRVVWCGPRALFYRSAERCDPTKLPGCVWPPEIGTCVTANNNFEVWKFLADLDCKL